MNDEEEDSDDWLGLFLIIAVAIAAFIYGLTHGTAC